ncbi:MAG: hypothetical protein C4519_03225 [Desulfobacteraceae bacterium]|nr:MAG: hypothetical protein C4519_03225 [Desulfobacteraceae bacterium]
MKPTRLLFIMIFLLPAACARLPEIRTPSDAARTDPAAACARIFPHGRWQFVHSIEAAPPDGARQTLLGVIQVSSRHRAVHCIMMTVEGLVILEARYDGAVHIQRAVPPMDRPGLAEGVIRDLLLVFFAPEQPARQAGFVGGGDPICRYPLPDGGIQDIQIKDNGQWTIRRYTARRRMIRSVHSDPGVRLSSLGFPTRLVLQAQGLLGYRLTMTLLEATPLEDP